MYLFSIFANNAEIVEENDIQEQIKDDLQLLNTPIAFLTVDELTSQYEANTLKANQNYSGFAIEVTGVIESIDREITGRPYISLGSLDNEYNVWDVQCIFDRGNDDELYDLTTGTEITLSGVVSGDVLLTVVMEECGVK